MAQFGRKHVLRLGLLSVPIYGGYVFYRDFLEPTHPISCKPGSLMDNRIHSHPGSVVNPCWYDCYQMKIKLANSSHYQLTNLIKDKNGNIIDKNRQYSTLMTKSWLMCPAFIFEKWLLRTVGVMTKTDEEIMTNSYDINDKIGVWKVAAKTNNEILVEFTDPYTKWVGATYFSIYPSISDAHENNSGHKKNNDKEKQFVEWTVHFGTASVDPPQLPLLSALLTPMHSLYSRILLASTARQFIADCSVSDSEST